MTMRTQLMLVAGISAIVGLGTGFFAGVFSGTAILSFSNGAPEAMIVTADLEALRRGKTEAAISSMEQRLDGAILMHGRFLETGYRWILYPWRTEQQFGKYDAYMRRVARYRKAYPSESPLAHYKDDPQYANGVLLFDSISGNVRQVLEKYEK
jgi:hypothetical protein